MYTVYWYRQVEYLSLIQILLSYALIAEGLDFWGFYNFLMLQAYPDFLNMLNEVPHKFVKISSLKRETKHRLGQGIFRQFRDPIWVPKNENIGFLELEKIISM